MKSSETVMGSVWKLNQVGEILSGLPVKSVNLKIVFLISQPKSVYLEIIFLISQPKSVYLKIIFLISQPKSVYLKIIFLISQPKHMLWVLKRTVSMRRFFWAPKTHVCLNWWIRKKIAKTAKNICLTGPMCYGPNSHHGRPKWLFLFPHK